MKREQRCWSSRLGASVFPAKRPHAPCFTVSKFDSLRGSVSRSFLFQIFLFDLILVLTEEAHHTLFEEAALIGNVYWARHTRSRRGNLQKLVHRLVAFRYIFLVQLPAQPGARKIWRRHAVLQLVVAIETVTAHPGLIIFKTKRENIFGGNEYPQWSGIILYAPYFGRAQKDNKKYCKTQIATYGF